MKKTVAALLAALAVGAFVLPAAADEMADVYAQILADPGNIALNLHYAALAEAAGKPRLALAAYERILLNDPDNAEAQIGIKRIMRKLQPNTTRWIASAGAGWEANPSQVPSHEDSSMIETASLAVRDTRYFGSTAWQTDALGVVNIVNNESHLDYGFLGGETGPVFDTDSWFSIHPAAGVGYSYFDHTTFYTEATGSVTLEGVTAGADQIIRLKVGYRDYASHFTTDGGWYAHLNARWSVPHIFTPSDVFIISPWARWSDINGGVFVALNRESEPGRYFEVGSDFAYFAPVNERLVLGANLTLADRWYREPGLVSGKDDRHDTLVEPGATLIFKHVFWAQSDLRVQYRHMDNNSNDKARDFRDDIVTINIDTRF